MKRIFKNAKIALSVIAGLLLTVIVLGAGTWSWFTSVADGKTGDFDTGYVWLEYESAAPTMVYNVPTNNVGATYQSDLEALANDAAFASHIANAGGFSNYVTVAKLTTPTPPLATPGSLVQGGCIFENNSNVPVYFRVETATVTSGTKSLDILQMSTATISISGTPGSTTVRLVPDSTNSYLYCTTPLTGGETIEVGVVAYIRGAQNPDDSYDGTTKTSTNGLEDITFNFGGAGSGELIQADNNAVYLVSGWSDIAW